MGYTYLTSGITNYLPLILVGAGAVILLMIAVAALLMLRGQKNACPAEKPTLHPVQTKQPGAGHLMPVEISFHQIGKMEKVSRIAVVPELWVSVGMDSKADICLNPSDQIRFRLCMTARFLRVAATAGEIAVNGVPIEKLGDVPLASGDLLRVGSYEYRVIYPTAEEREMKQ